jgi:hypothetical protein
MELSGCWRVRTGCGPDKLWRSDPKATRRCWPAAGDLGLLGVRRQLRWLVSADGWQSEGHPHAVPCDRWYSELQRVLRPERLVIRRGNRVVVRRTIAGGRPYVLSLPTGEYQLSVPNLELAGIATVRVGRTSEANVGLQELAASDSFHYSGSSSDR